ncbi:tissue inhibitor of metalloproteases [Colletes latitarsis]|uniref:tissue inhibitor of metalloproteases n=1 Tax=Colletes latitarsis TaxID=2605962 RepID=UPI0040355DA3
MWPLTFWTYFLLIALSLAPVQRVVGCSCARTHPQKLFCNSDYVAVVRVRRVKHVPQFETAYNVKVNKVFKERNKFNPAEFSKQEILWTASMDSMCGITLNVGDTYLVSAKIIDGKMHISSCNISMRWREVTSRQRKGFRGLYHRGCACEIDYIFWWQKGAVLENSGRKRCLWESEPGPEECQEKYGVCLAGPGGCSWTPSVPYKNCIKEYQRRREYQRLREP